MRLQLSLRATSKSQFIPINYNYPIAAWIYRVLYESSPDYAEFLHDRGYSGSDGKLRKLFTFSRLLFSPRAFLHGDSLRFTPQHRITLLFSSPMINDFIQHLVIGLFQNQVVTISNSRVGSPLMVEQVEALPEPEWKPRMRFRALSPIVVTTKHEHLGRVSKYYMRPDDPALSEQIRTSLVRKFETVHGISPAQAELTAEPDLSKHLAHPERAMTLVKLKEGQPDQTNVKGFLCPLILTGSPDLIRTAWECGIGDQTSMGFGCLGVGEKP